LSSKSYTERREKDTKDFYQSAFLTGLGIFSILSIIIGLVGKFGADLCAGVLALGGVTAAWSKGLRGTRLSTALSP
jgi:hypothetical protein